MGTDYSQVVNDLINKLSEVQKRRFEGVGKYFETNDPEAINNIIVDAINLLVTLYVLNNFPEDGFKSYGN